MPWQETLRQGVLDGNLEPNTMKLWKITIPSAALLLSGASPAAATPKAPVQVVESLDLARYAGKWYEIARLPNRFQRACAGDTTATYTLRPDGRIDVLNQCREADGKLRSARAVAKRAGGNEPTSKLKVTFFWPFQANYWVIALDPDYRWAVVGEPGRKYLWILSRTPQMDETEYERVLSLIEKQGYQTKNLLRTAHSAGVSAQSRP